MSHTKHHLNLKLVSLFLTLLILFVGFFFVHHIHAANSPLKVGVVSNDAPLSSKTSSHKPTGANVVVAKKLAQKLNRSVQIVTVKNQTELKSQLRQGQVDLGLGYFSPTKKQYSWQTSQPIFYLDNVLFRRADGKQKSLVKLTGKKVGKLTTGPQAAILKKLALKEKNYASPDTLVAALKKKQIRAAVLTGPQYATYLQQHPEFVQAKDHTDPRQTKQVLKRISDPQLTGQTVRVVSYDHRRLTRQVSRALKQLKQSGELNQISRRFFGKDLTLE